MRCYHANRQAEIDGATLHDALATGTRVMLRWHAFDIPREMTMGGGMGGPGSRGIVQPWERGWKDTVLVLSGERVAVLIRFERHRALFLLHCHDLEHEDHGTMLNSEVE